MQKILITTELRNYIERLTYEKERYDDLLNSVTKETMTEEEWQSSYEYFTDLCNKANLRYQFAMEEIYDIYKTKIKNNNWYIDFVNCCIFICDFNETMIKSVSNESYQDFLVRIYPEYTSDDSTNYFKINGIYAKDITLQVTNACNMACTYCYQHTKNNKKMEFETAKKFIDMILDADERTNTYLNSTKNAGAIINFIGGEPLLEIELITKISSYFINEIFRRKHPWAIRFVFSICSNGLLHFEPLVQEYLKNHQNHLYYNLSIDGDKELHDACRVDHFGNGTYNRVHLALKDYYQKFNITPGSKITISPNNVNKISQALKTFIQDFNYQHININCVYEEGWSPSHANILYQQLHEFTDWLFDNELQDKVTISIFSEQCGYPQSVENNTNWCGGLGLMIAVDYSGNIYPCLRYTETSSNPNNSPFIIGNVNEGINQSPEQQKCIECMECITRRSQSSDECFYCPISSGCGWCSAYNYEQFGTPNKRATYICCMHKARVLANVYYWRRRGINYPMNCPKEWAIEIIGEQEYNKLQAMEIR